MAHLFKNNVLQEKLALSIVPKFDERIEIIKQWHSALKDKSLLKKTETQCEQAFNDDFFINILGYTRFPSEKYTIEVKADIDTSGGQKPDAALGFFMPEGNVVQCVCEIKDANTPLDKPQQREGNLTPVQQGFKYKPLYKNCGFVIVTNFREIRLYRDTMHDYECFTLEELANPDDDHRNFRKFHYLLSAEHFITERGKSNTEELLAAVRIEQENITKKFYEHYRTLRQDLIRNIVTNLPNSKTSNFSKVVEQAQKIIDRVVFIAFCEDVGLLPENKLAEVVDYTEKGGLDIPIWDIMKRFFTAIDKGSKKMEVPYGFNGELFKEDKELDSLMIDDKICREFVRIGRFNFDDDLPANILGHIFEQSISDIEELKRIGSIEEADQISKRKKDGIYYTPEYIVDFIVSSTLGKHLEELEQEKLEKHGVNENLSDSVYAKKAAAAYQEYLAAIGSITVLDLACGSGAFLVKVFDYLRKEHERISQLLEELTSEKSMLSRNDMIKMLLHQNIFGVDLNEESVEITKLSLWLKTAQKGKKLEELKENIKCGNSLIDDLSISDRAFEWEKEFAKIFKNGGFDIVVGNPPYGADIPERETKFLKQHFDSYEYQANTYSLFYEKGMSLLKNGGYLGYITPATFTYQHYFNKLRGLLAKYSVKHLTKYNYKVFEDADIGDTISLILKKGSQDKRLTLRTCISEEDAQVKQYHEIEASQLFSKDGTWFLNDESANITSSIKGVVPLGKISHIIVGIKAYQGGKGNPKQTKEIVKNKIFTSDNREDNTYIRCVNGKDFHKFGFVAEPEMFISYGKWLAEPRETAPFFEEKIIVRQTADSIIAHLDKTGWINLNNVYNIKSTDDDFSNNYLLGLLNSKLLNYIYQTIAQEKGKIFAEVKKVYLQKIPIKKANAKNKRAIEEVVEKLLVLTTSLQKVCDGFAKIITSEFDTNTSQKKLGKFYRNSFEKFCNSIKKIPLGQKKELLEFFEDYKNRASNIDKEISESCKELDEMVCNLYGLNEAEKAIVLQGST
ncbi:Eco57I restriction-modification methylase domain-containing protein [Patescibacteria group bacterium]|nr:Eco57I restriction-modification methylase domain-containing protein [Patescibacteria group bacterium]